MKKSAVLLTLLLVFMLAAGGSLQGHSLLPPNPGGTSGENPTDTDDHPWGGDDTGSGCTASPNNSSIIIGYPVLDAFLFQLIDWWHADTPAKSSGGNLDHCIVQDQTTSASSISTQRMEK